MYATAKFTRMDLTVFFLQRSAWHVTDDALGSTTLWKILFVFYLLKINLQKPISGFSLNARLPEICH